MLLVLCVTSQLDEKFAIVFIISQLNIKTNDYILLSEENIGVFLLQDTLTSKNPEMVLVEETF